MKTALIVYSSNTGNTRKVAEAIREGLEAGGVTVKVREPKEAVEEDFFDYDLVCVGSPSIEWKPEPSIIDFMKTKFSQYRSEGKIKLCAPKIEGKNALIFCTYSGPHTGINEATPVVKILGQYFEHLGFTLVGEWYVVGEFHGRLEFSTLGRLGDIRGKPTSTEIEKIKNDATKIAQALSR